MSCSRRWDWRLSYLDVTPFGLENSVPTFRRNQLTPSSWQNSNTVRRGSRFSVMSIPTTNLHDFTFHTTLIFRKKNSCSCQQPVHLHLMQRVFRGLLNPLNPEWNPICYLLALLGAHHFLHVSRVRVKLLTFRRLMSYIYGAGGRRFGGTSSSAHFSNSYTNPTNRTWCKNEYIHVETV